MNLMKELYAAYPGEVIAHGVIALACAVGLATLIMALMWPETDSFEEASEC